MERNIIKSNFLPKYIVAANNNPDRVTFEDIARLDRDILEQMLPDHKWQNYEYEFHTIGKKLPAVCKELELKIRVGLICHYIDQMKGPYYGNKIEDKDIEKIKRHIDKITQIQSTKKDELFYHIQDKVENSYLDFKDDLKGIFKDIITFPEKVTDEPDVEGKSVKESKLELSIKNLTEGQNAIIINNQQIARTKETDKQTIQTHIETAIELTAQELKIEKREVEEFLDKLSEINKSKLNTGNLTSGNKEGFQNINLAGLEKTKHNSLISKTLQKHNKLETIEGRKYQSKEGTSLGVRSYRLALIRDALKSENVNQK